MRSAEIVHHVYRDDGRTRRCGHTRSDGEPCGLPRGNRAHDMPENRYQAEERRRLGEREDSE